MLTVLIGKTCSGKNAVLSKLVKEYSWKPIVTYTTRPKRKGEKEGREYHFIDGDDFKRKIDDGFFAEWKSYNVDGKIWYYGSPLKEIEEAAQDNDNHIIILTPDGVEDVFITVQSSKNIHVVYLYANRKTILNRLKKRKDTHDSIERRMRADDDDFRDAVSLSDIIVYNNDGDPLDDVVRQVYSRAVKISF